MDIENLKIDWLEYQDSLMRIKSDSDREIVFEQNSELIEMLDGIVKNDPENCWLFIVDVIDDIHEEQILANLGAGILEDVLVHHGEILIDRVEKLAAQDLKFKKTLSCVWKNRISDEVWNRIQPLFYFE